MNRKNVVRLGFIIIAIVAVLLTLHFGGGWAVETFKEMHGM
jgi:hypothetical protein